MSILVIFEFNAKPEHTKDITTFLRDGLFHTRGFDGCNSITIHENQDDRNNIVFVENWDSKEQYEKYLAWRTDRGDVDKLISWMASPPSIRRFDNVGV